MAFASIQKGPNYLVIAADGKILFEEIVKLGSRTEDSSTGEAGKKACKEPYLIDHYSTKHTSHSSLSKELNNSQSAFSKLENRSRTSLNKAGYASISDMKEGKSLTPINGIDGNTTFSPSNEPISKDARLGPNLVIAADGKILVEDIVKLSNRTEDGSVVPPRDEMLSDVVTSVIKSIPGVLDFVHSDVWGPVKHVSNGGARSFEIFIDDFSRKVWVYFMKHESEVIDVFQQWKARVGNQRDNGMEYKDEEFLQFCKDKGIIRHFSLKRTLEQNESTTALSTTEAEYMVLREAAKEAL
ncbi:hypothetical protein RJ639_011555 [Escallonia herrerae]|uniref:Integrase catalytic domain-containing protein n=1 Tax=Escallonia herrerae TaxID=1293975 RepID=A0AA88VP67_9ASTE|nr:hypothetical protein RJ639_011555 [Escallonia herrerae]